MPKHTAKTWFISTVASVALMTAVSADTRPAVSAGSSSAGALAAQAQAQVLRKLSLADGGVYAVHAPANSGAKVMINGRVVVDATGTRGAEVGQTITGIMTLQAGDHLVAVTGVTEDTAIFAQLRINAVGQDQEALQETTVALEPAEADAILAARASLSLSGGSAVAVNAAPSAATPIQSAQSQPSTVQTAAARSPSSGRDRAERDESSRIRLVSSTGRLSMIGDVPALPEAYFTTPLDIPTLSAGAVALSPLSPPRNVALTQAVELTTLGNDQGEVPATGTTLFGAVMEGSGYDQVNVVVAPVNRTATVDVGPQTGQFAVRLFAEDFAQGSAVTVTLTGGSSAGNEVAATPVEYNFTGVLPVDGATQALSRLSFGPTPALYARIRNIGFQGYLTEQLNPERIRDTTFIGMNPGSLLNRREENTGRLLEGLQAHSAAHALFSEKQLLEVMARFWSNHFHAITKDTRIVTQNIDDMEFFRANAFGNFEDMLLYSAESPLMSQYLDNDQNRRGNINENYGREILELSTVGVDAPYTDEDVIEVSRIFTGWAYRRTNEGAEDVAQTFEFEFFPDRHDTDDKTISFLNLTIAGRSGEAGVQEGRELIAVLARHPLTQSRICGKIVQLLVADEPPARFINACVGAWGESGDIRNMLSAILTDPAYIQSVEYQRTKTKTPFEYAISAARALGARPTGDADNRRRFYRELSQVHTRAGLDFLRFADPTGLPEDGASWTNSAVQIASYQEMTQIAVNPARYGWDVMGPVRTAGLETAEEVAAYMLSIMTADRFTEEEFNAMLVALKDSDGIFEPLGPGRNEERAMRRAAGLAIVIPSFSAQ